VLTADRKPGISLERGVQVTAHLLIGVVEPLARPLQRERLVRQDGQSCLRIRSASAKARA